VNGVRSDIDGGDPHGTIVDWSWWEGY